jgi:hypothetical protein
MEKELIPKFEKFISKEIKPLNEMATINDIKRDTHIMPGTYRVEVYSEDHNPPHFHYSNNDGMDIKVDILTLEVIASEPRIGISNKDLKSWIGLSDERKILLKWLKNKNTLDNKSTNYKTVAFTWNLFHRNDLIDYDNLKKI